MVEWKNGSRSASGIQSLQGSARKRILERWSKSMAEECDRAALHGLIFRRLLGVIDNEDQRW